MIENPNCLGTGFQTSEMIQSKVLQVTDISGRTNIVQSFSDIRFTCDGIITKWIVGINDVTGNTLPNIQLLRSNMTVITSLTVDTNNRISTDTNVYEFTSLLNAEVKTGDILVVNSTDVPVYYQQFNGPQNYMINSSNALVEVEENNYPLISVEVGKSFVDSVNKCIYFFTYLIVPTFSTSSLIEITSSSTAPVEMFSSDMMFSTVDTTSSSSTVDMTFSSSSVVMTSLPDDMTSSSVDMTSSSVDIIASVDMTSSVDSITSTIDMTSSSSSVDITSLPDDMTSSSVDITSSSVDMTSSVDVRSSPISMSSLSLPIGMTTSSVQIVTSSSSSSQVPTLILSTGSTTSSSTFTDNSGSTSQSSYDESASSSISPAETNAQNSGQATVGIAVGVTITIIVLLFIIVIVGLVIYLKIRRGKYSPSRNEEDGFNNPVYAAPVSINSTKIKNLNNPLYDDGKLVINL